LGSPVVNPIQYNCSAFAEVEYTEELEVGYRYYAAHPDAPPPLYPFGHGVGFSKFVYGGLKASSTEVTLTVQNTGLVSGVEIAQLYLGFPVASGEPPKVLAGFSRALVAKGATKTLQIPLTDRSLSTWSVTANAWVKVTGDFAVYVGASSADIRLTGKFTVG
jgi:beta-glucosidase